MMKKTFIALGLLVFLLSALDVGTHSALALSVYQIVQGGTGTSTAPTYGKVLTGDASGNWEYFATSTLGITASAAGSPGQLQYNSNNSFAAVSTSTLTASGPLTGSFIQVGSGGTLGCTTASSGVAGCLSNTSFDTFNNKQSTIGVTWPITLTGATVGFNGLSTSSAIAAGAAVLYATGVNTVASVATSSIGVSAGLTNSGTLGSQVGGTSLTLKQIENRSFSYATSTTWTGTTTIPLGVGYNEAWNTAKCFTDTGTLNVDFYHATTHFTFFNASTTKGTVNMNASTDTSGDSVFVDIGTPASTPAKIACTINDTI